MAFATPSSTPETRSMAYESPFISKSLTITVGPQKVPFTVHEAKLAQTSFFRIHVPLTGEQRAEALAAGVRQANTPADGIGTSSLEVKLEDEVTVCVPLVVPDYHVEDRFFLRTAAFNIFIKYLYNEPPVRPTKKSELMDMLRAYGVAVKYKCYGLQNTIVDRLRAYHSRTNVAFDNLIWARNRFGDNTACALNAYFVQQVAFEISDRGFNDYAEKNSSLRTFVREGDDNFIRLALFEALAQYAHGTSKGDPAITGHKFHVYETGERAGQLKD